MRHGTLRRSRDTCAHTLDDTDTILKRNERKDFVAMWLLQLNRGHLLMILASQQSKQDVDEGEMKIEVKNSTNSPSPVWLSG